MCLGIPGKIVELYESGGLKMGRVDFGGVVRETCLAYVPEAQLGDYTIVHVGFALNLIDEAEARKTRAAGRNRSAGRGIRDAGRMKYITEYRDAARVRDVLDGSTASRPGLAADGGAAVRRIRSSATESINCCLADRDDPRSRLPGLRHLRS